MSRADLRTGDVSDLCSRPTAKLYEPRRLTGVTRGGRADPTTGYAAIAVRPRPQDRAKPREDAIRRECGGAERPPTVANLPILPACRIPGQSRSPAEPLRPGWPDPQYCGAGCPTSG